MKKTAFLLLFVSTVFCVNAQNNELHNFKRANQHIQAEYFHANGSLAQTGTYNLQNQLDGLWTNYDELGTKISQGQYRRGQKVGLWTFFQDDKLVLVEYDNSKIIQVTDLTITDNPVVTRFDRD